LEFYLLLRGCLQCKSIITYSISNSKNFNECFGKEGVGKIYNAEEDKYILFAID
jgi:hypothetical protein